MADELRVFTVSTAAGVPLATPQVTALTLPARRVTGIRVRIPPGPRGNLGWALSVAGTRVIPWNAGAYFVGDDELVDEDLQGQIDSGAWQLTSYNTGLYAHVVYITFRLQLVGARGGSDLSAPLTIVA